MAFKHVVTNVHGKLLFHQKQVQTLINSEFYGISKY